MDVKQHDAVFTATSVYSLLGVGAMLLAGYTLSKSAIPHARAKERTIFVWLAFDALIHAFFEGSFLWVSTFGRSAQTSDTIPGALWREYAKADARWGLSDPTVVSLEILTVLGCMPICLYIMRQITLGNIVKRHFWTIVLSTSELYGGFMTFAPEWLTGSPSLRTDNALHFWVYLFFMNTIWVVIPFWLLFDSFQALSKLEPAKVRKVK